MIDNSYKNIQRKFSQSARIFFYVIFSITFYYLSYSFSKAYQLGDQVFYRDLYHNLSYASFDEIFEYQLFHTGSSEPLFGIISWLGARLRVEKDIYFSILNTLFAITLLQFLLQNSAKHLFITLSFLNFYFLVMIGPAERLKTAILFTLISATFKNRYFKYGFLVSALFCHLQTILIIAARFTGYLTLIFSSRFFNKRTYKLIAAGGVISISFTAWFLSNFSKTLLFKFESYQGNHGITAILNILILIVFSYFIFKNKHEVILTLGATAIAASLLGPERVNMMAFLLFSFFAVTQKKTHHPLVIFTMVYFASKGILFAMDVYERGTGF